MTPGSGSELVFAVWQVCGSEQDWEEAFEEVPENKRSFYRHTENFYLLRSIETRKLTVFQRHLVAQTFVCRVAPDEVGV